jgi:amino acid transporter
MLALTPVVWSLPVALAMAEMASALPDEGGYVVWVRRAFGPFWGFQVGWWSWLNSFVDVAVYPALFADYLKFWWPAMGSVERFAAALVFIWLLTGLNLAGVRLVGRSAVALGVFALVPMAVFTVVAATRATHAPWLPLAAPGQGLVEGLGLGLAVMMWNYSGWDTPSTCLGETRAPETAFRRALFMAVPLISLAYLLPVAAGLSATSDWKAWDTGHWPVMAAAVGGPGLASLVTIGALGLD